MEARVLNDIVIIKSPNTLTKGSPHDVVVNELADKNSLVILLSFGDEEYEFPDDYVLPENVRCVHYDYESLDDSLGEIQNCLSGFGIGIVSRHNRQSSPLPFLLTGSILTLPEGTNLKIPESTDVNQTNKKQPKNWDIL